MAKEVYTQVVENGRFKFMEQMQAYPFKEVVNLTPDGPVFDIGVDLEDYDGVIYIKAEHIVEMARMIGMATVGEVASLNKTIDKLTKEVEVLPERIGAFTDELSSLVSRFHRNIGLSDADIASADRIEESKAAVAELKRIDEDARKANGQVVSFDLFKGLDDLSASPSNESANKSDPKG